MSSNLKWTLAVVFACFVLTDAADVFAQTLLNKGDGPVLLAEAGRRARRTRPRKSAPPAEAPAERSEAAEESGGEAPEAAPEDGEQPPAEAGQEGGAEGGGLEGEGNGFEGGEGAEQGFSDKIEGSTGSSLRRSNRMDFDERLVKGQGARSGAVYLFKRTPRKLPELVALRTTYRRRIIDPVLGDRGLPPPVEAAPEAEETPTKTEADSAEGGEEAAEAETPEKAEPSKAALRRKQARRRRMLRRREKAVKQKAQ